MTVEEAYIAAMDKWDIRERELLARNTELVEKVRRLEIKLTTLEEAARKMRLALKGLIKYHLSMRQVQHADKLLAEALGEGETKT